MVKSIGTANRDGRIVLELLPIRLSSIDYITLHANGHAVLLFCKHLAFTMHVILNFTTTS